METLEVRTGRRDQFVDITDRVRQFVSGAGLGDGALLVFIPHTTAAVTINEHADPSVVKDVQADLRRLVPWQQTYYEHREGNSPSHTRSAAIGSSELVILEGGELVLGTWQGIFFCEFDGPRVRKVHLQYLPA
jgi:secondary thiamine-phosphate synthase enzyme